MARCASRWAALALVAVVAAVAAGCGGSDETSGGTTTAPTATTPAKALKVGLVADAGELNDNGFNELAYKGLKRAERELGIEGRVVEANSAADYVPNMTTLARQGYDLIIGVGFAQGDAIAAAAKRFPKTSFAIVDVDQASLKGKPANVQGLLFREEQVGYLVGYLAALEAKRAGAKSDQRGRRLQGAAGRPLHRRLSRRRRGGRPGHEGALGLLAGLGGPGEVQGARAEPDRGRVEGRLPGRGRLRARRALGGEGRPRVGDRCRRRPVVPRPARADERAEGRRQRRIPRRSSRCRTERSTAARTSSSGSTRTASGSARSARTRTSRTSPRPRRSSGSSPTARSRTSRRPSARAEARAGALASAAPARAARQAVRTEYTGGR